MIRRSVALAFATASLSFTAFWASPAAAEDEWLGKDKLLHFSASAVIAGGAYGISALAIDGRTGRALVGTSAGIAAGAAKELYDMTGRGDPSWKDFTWDLIGTAVGVGAALLIDLAIRGSSRDAGSRTGVSQGALLAW